MGFWSRIGDIFKAATEVTAAGVSKATKYIGEKLKDAGEWIDKNIGALGKNESGPSINTTFISKGTSTANEEIKKKEREMEYEAIRQYQKEVEKHAKEREEEVKNTYLKIYKKYIADFEEVLDAELMDKIKSNIKDTSHSFDNTLRDEVNTKVNSSNQSWKQLIASKPSPRQVRFYCETVYTEANNDLLDLLQLAIKDTNKIFSKCINKYNDDKAKALAEMKESLIKLTAAEETKALELKKIAEEVAVALFIANEASLDI